jgi:hypothetical protein
VHGTGQVGTDPGHSIESLASRPIGPSAHSRAPHAVFPPEPRLFARQRPRGQPPRLEGIAVEADQLAAKRHRPAGPVVVQRDQVAEAAQVDRRPRDAVTSGLPVPDGLQAHAKVVGAGLAGQAAASAQLAETVSGDVRQALAGLPGSLGYYA